MKESEAIKKTIFRTLKEGKCKKSRRKVRIKKPDLVFSALDSIVKLASKKTIPTSKTESANQSVSVFVYNVQGDCKIFAYYKNSRHQFKECGYEWIDPSYQSDNYVSAVNIRCTHHIPTAFTSKESGLMFSFYFFASELSDISFACLKKTRSLEIRRLMSQDPSKDIYTILVSKTGKVYLRSYWDVDSDLLSLEKHLSESDIPMDQITKSSNYTAWSNRFVSAIDGMYNMNAVQLSGSGSDIEVDGRHIVKQKKKKGWSGQLQLPAGLFALAHTAMKTPFIREGMNRSVMRMGAEGPLSVVSFGSELKHPYSSSVDAIVDTNFCPHCFTV